MAYVSSLTPISVSLNEEPKPLPLIISRETPVLPTQTVSMDPPDSKVSPNEIWGPLLWRILHTVVEQLGKSQNAVLQTDEVQKWIHMMKAVEHTMPCALCRNHYKEWLIKHPLSALSSLRGLPFREGARKYVWQLHETVNANNGKSSGISLTLCSQVYSSFETLQETLDAFTKYVQEQILTGRMKGEGLREFRTQLTYVRKLTDSI